MTTRPKLPHPPRRTLWNNEKQNGPGCAGTHHRADASNTHLGEVCKRMESVTTADTAGRGRHGCSHCDARWTGANVCHCSGCHRTFGGLGGFEKHRKDYTCTDPSTVGMTQNQHGTWGAPSSGVDFRKIFKQGPTG